MWDENEDSDTEGSWEFIGGRSRSRSRSRSPRPATSGYSGPFEYTHRTLPVHDNEGNEFSVTIIEALHPGSLHQAANQAEAEAGAGGSCNDTVAFLQPLTEISQSQDLHLHSDNANGHAKEADAVDPDPVGREIHDPPAHPHALSSSGAGDATAMTAMSQMTPSNATTAKSRPFSGQVPGCDHFVGACPVGGGHAGEAGQAGHFDMKVALSAALSPAFQSSMSSAWMAAFSLLCPPERASCA